ncbi:MAG TPA: hypothetical protein VK919_09055 [Solirubrobacterales bacterium]|nr:hypothetical protein [Solirubrobacterales bacterium]
MADAGLFIGWGPPVRGREAKSLEVFNEAVAFHGGLQESGEIESFEVVFLGPHGGDLAGFILVRGSQEQIAALRDKDEFDRLNTRAGLIVERLGVVDAALGEGLGRLVGIYQEAVDELT